MIDQYKIKLGDLLPNLRDIAVTIGLGPTQKLVDACSGEGIWPK